MPTKNTCANCKYMGDLYFQGSGNPLHACLKKDERRQAYADQTPGADFFDHFRNPFNAIPHMKACGWFEQKPVAVLAAK